MVRSDGVVAAATLLLLLLPAQACSNARGPATKPAAIQAAVVAGSFYPADVGLLKAEVAKFLAQAPAKPIDGTILGIIAPHAGYQYSGPIAGAAFKQVEGRDYARVVVMAPSHHAAVEGAALSSRDLYRTPLGDIPIDTAAVQGLLGKYRWAKDDQAPYAQEHALEVELPFLQTVLKGFQLVPMIIGMQHRETLDAIADGLAETFPSEDTLFVASTDLSHYLTYEKATADDRRTIGIMCEKDTEAFANGVATEEAKLCGAAPVYVLKRLAEKRGAKFQLIEYANSGDTAGDKSRVVGYAAIVAVVPPSIGDVQKKALLRLARETLAAHVTKKKLPPLPNDPVLTKDGAAFVTLKKRGELRGCIGHIIARQPLGKTVQEMAVAAASEDPRFPPVRAEELPEIDVEVSVLTAPTELRDPLSVRVGTDGLIIEKGSNRGVLLPQVPTEQGWNRDQYLDGICHKAGMQDGCWKDAKLYRFQAIVFGEK